MEYISTTNGFITTPMITLLTLSILFCCLIVISSNSAVTSVLYLIFTFIFVACYLCCLNIPYLGLTYIIIYVGAIIVLLLFVIIIINLNNYGDINSNSIKTSLNKYGNLNKQIRSNSVVGPTIPLIILAILLYIYNIVKGTGIMELSINQSKSLFQLINEIILFGPSSHGFSMLDYLPSTDINYFSNLSSLQSFFGFSAGSANQIQSIALELYSHQAIWLILISFVLIISIIGPIVICRVK